ncbi:MAG: spore germination protein [Bacillus cereus]|nr:spore germination protein [Bacillus cereus]
MGVSKVSEYQLATFIACSISANGIMIFREMFRIGKQDAWFSYLLPMLYAILLVMVTVYILKGEQTENLLQLNKKLFGIFGGSLANFLVSIYTLFLIGLEVSKLANTIKYYLLPKTPLPILVITLVLTIAYLAHAGIEVILRFGNLVFIPYALAIFILPFLLFNEIEVSNLLPIATNDLKHMVQESFSQFALFGEVLLFLILLGNTSKKQISKHALVRGTILGAFLLTFICVLTIISVGVPITSNAYLAPIFLVQLVHIAEFMDRFDLFLFSTWFLCYLIRIVFFYFLLCSSISLIGKEDKYNKEYAILLIPLVSIVSLVFFQSEIRIFNFEKFPWQIFTFGFQFLLLGGLLLKKWTRRSVL